MEPSSALSLSLVIFLPTVVAILLSFVPKGSDDLVKMVTLITTILTFGLTIGLIMLPFEIQIGSMQMASSLRWIPSFDIDYFMGVDGISLPLVVLTAFISVVSLLAAWSITKNIKAFCMLFLVLETGMLGVFLALDFFLFYVFWEVMLLPMYFLIGIWGGPRKEYAAIKFFLYTLLGSVLMLVAILMLYFASDLTVLARQGGEDWNQFHLRDSVVTKVNETVALGDESTPIHTFNLLALAAMGQQTELFSTAEILFDGWTIQHWAFLLLFIGFAIKVPLVPVHTWLPDAHVEAPTPISMILAGVLLKMGGYGILRICYPICPHAGYDFAWFVCSLGVLSMVYGAFAALAQTDFKRMVAYSSVSHMGYVVLGMGVWSVAAANGYDPQAWNMGVKGAMFQMIGHGISSAGMFFMVGVIYERVHHRNLNEFGGLYGRMPVYTSLAMIIFFAGLGLPGLCGFIGEVFVVLSVWKFSQLLAVISAGVVVLTAGYILWAIQRVYLGPEYKGPHGDHLTPLTMRELFVGTVLAVFAVIFGVFPYHTVLRYMDATIDQQVLALTEWTKTVKGPLLLEEQEAVPAEGLATQTAATSLTAVDFGVGQRSSDAGLSTGTTAAD
jgi:NADH-quinone oxidoreductase subunit M